MLFSRIFNLLLKNTIIFKFLIKDFLEQKKKKSALLKKIKKNLAPHFATLNHKMIFLNVAKFG